MKQSHQHITITKLLKIAVLGTVLLASITLYAAKGDTKTKKGVVLKFSGFDLKANNNYLLLSKPGFLYNGNFMNIDKVPQNTYINSVITVQKGNTTFIYPYKIKTSVPLFKTPAPVQH